MNTTAEPESGTQAPALQGINRLQTGYSLSQLADFIEGASRSWKEHDQVPVQLLRALCRLTRNQPDKAMDGFTAFDLALEIRQERPNWAAPADKNEASRRISKPFDSLQNLLAKKQEHLAELAVSGGLTALPAVDKEQGGGQGLASRYRLHSVPLDAEVFTAVSGLPALAAGEISYFIEDSALYKAWTAQFAQGITMTGWVRRLFFGTGLLLIAGCALYAVAVFVIVIFLPTVQAQLSAVVILLLFAAAIYIEILPPLRVVTERILVAPFWLQGFDDNWLLEWRCPPLHPVKTMHRVRYAGVCSVCGGRVNVGSKSWLLPANRLIGRCENAPTAHRFTFDHVTRRGARLR